MSQAADLLSRGFDSHLSALGEEIIFRGQKIRAVVASRDPEFNLETGGWSAEQTFNVELPVTAVVGAPRSREPVTVRGLQLVIRTVTPPAPHRRSWSILVSTP